MFASISLLDDMSTDLVRLGLLTHRHTCAHPISSHVRAHPAHHTPWQSTHPHTVVSEESDDRNVSAGLFTDLEQRSTRGEVN